MKYLDTNIFLYPVLFTDAKGAACRDLLKGAASGQFDAVTSCLTWDEFVYVLLRTLGREVAAAQGAMLLQFPGLVLAPADAAILARAQDLITNTPLRPRDALHAATALRYGAAAFVSDDPDFDHLPGLVREPPLNSAGPAPDQPIKAVDPDTN